MTLDIEIMQVETGEIATLISEWDERDEWPPFFWTDGNFSCDCNRELEFYRVKGQPRSVDHAQCGSGRYCVKLTAGDQIYDELSEVAP
jgi:hypothetical protein